MTVKFEEIYVGQTLYDKWRQVEVLWKGESRNHKDEVIPDVYVTYVNEPAAGHPVLKGNADLSEDPVHCWNCQKDLIDNVRLTVCDKCHRAICTDFRCAECHCDTIWDPTLKRRVSTK